MAGDEEGSFASKMINNKDRNQPAANIAGKLESNGKWVMDSGATVHITHRTDWLDNEVKTSNEVPVVIPNDQSIPVEGRGTCTLPNGIRISDVLHVPRFRCNLLSVNRLSKDLQCTVTFFPTFCVMQSLSSKRIIGVGKCRGGLYEMDMVGIRRKAMVTTLDTWHKRLGHASHDKLLKFDFSKNLSAKTNALVCDPCARAKHTRLPFPVSFIKTKDCFELIHCDIWGRYRTPSLTKASYFLTIVDDYS
ncbi:putative RNA-directed DNA polymerase [Helianthus annuus]|nr:putative RNA-directed DNA polymerase [Helianthus annuus]